MRPTGAIVSLPTRPAPSASPPAPSCVASDQAREDRREAEYARLFPTSKSLGARTIQGVPLEDTQKALDIAEGVLGARPPVAWANAARACSPARVLCAIEAAFGDHSAARDALIAGARFGYYISPGQEENPVGQEQVFSASEVRRILELLERLPPAFQNLSTMYRILRMKDGLIFANEPHTTAFASFGKIVFTGAMSSDDLEYNLLHELGHHVDFSAQKLVRRNGQYYYTVEPAPLPARFQNGFAEISWTRDPGAQDGTSDPAWKKTDGSGFVSDYAATSVSEDFAESVAQYLYHPQRLKRRSPRKFEIMGRILGPPAFETATTSPLIGQWISEHGGPQAAILSCLQNTSWVISSGGELRFLSPIEGNSGIVLTLDQLAYAPDGDCFARLERRMRPEIESSAEFCRITGGNPDRSLRAAIAKQLEADVTSMLGPEGLFNPGYFTGSRSVESSGLDPAFATELRRLIRRFPTEFSFSTEPSDPQSMSTTGLTLAEARKFSSDLVENGEVGRIALACLQQLKPSRYGSREDLVSRVKALGCIETAARRLAGPNGPWIAYRTLLGRDMPGPIADLLETSALDRAADSIPGILPALSPGIDAERSRLKAGELY